jgi:aspartyl-tRNA(Asn)/glutamyl-tRNA(Gln) amidotransferase subunit B
VSLDDYEMVVGLEVHVQLKTRSKAFCACSTQYGAPPNVNTCPVCLALPGTLPVLNAEAVRLAVLAAHALSCTVNRISVFARKNYFYPDLPKGYQISQFDRPLASKGSLKIGENGDGSPIVIRVHRLHLEEDAGKSIHDRFQGATAIDLNRAGVPLVEIVSEPDMRSAQEAGAYLRALKQILEFTDVSDVNMEEGSLRVDANISARLRGETKLGTKTEVKNLNSFSAVERALEAEFARQVRLLERGGRVEQQTMLWDASRGTSRPARSKEESHDYRYFPEPDLPPLVLSKQWIDELREKLPELPAERRERFMAEYGLPRSEVEVLTSSVALADYFEQAARAHGDPRTAANWIRGEVLAAIHNENLSIREFPVRPSDLAELLGLVRDGKISNTAAKRIFAEMRRTGERPAQIAEREGLLQEGSEDAISVWIDEVMQEHPEEARRFLAGERKLVGVLVGAVMKKSSGRADPRRVNQLLSSRSTG